MPLELDFGSVDFITIGTIGPPGQRVFHLQFASQDTLMTLVLEKEQSIALAESVGVLLDEIEEKFHIRSPEIDRAGLDLELREPILPAFRIAQVGLGYDVEADIVVLVAYELQLEDAIEEQQVIRLACTREQMRTLAQHAEEVAKGGRPICGNCGQPIDADGHFCPKSNGHGRKVIWA